MNWAIKERDYSQRRACALVGMAPKTYRHVPARPDDSMLMRPVRGFRFLALYQEVRLSRAGQLCFG